MVAHTDEAATMIFGITRQYLRSLKGTEFDLDLESRQMAGVTWAAGSDMRVYSAKEGDRAGKGGTLNGIHYSECANFSDQGQNPDHLYSSIQSSLASQDPDLIEILESTAKGRDVFFHGLVEESLAGLNNYVVLFYPWFIHDEYSMTWSAFRRQVMSNPLAVDPGPEFVPTEEERILRRKMNSMVVAPQERTYRYCHELTDEQLIWRRWCMANRCRGKLEIFHRYFPGTLEEAFSSSEHTMFDQEAIIWYRERCDKHIARGNAALVRNVPYFLQDNQGNLKVWQFPKPDEDYVIGADVAEGRRGGDFSSAYVIEKDTMRVVAAYHGLVEWDHYADALEALGHYYNQALLVIENNYSPATADVIHKRGYPNLYYYRDEATLRSNTRGKPGFNTNKKTRPELMQRMEQAVREKALTCPDKQFWQEAETFVWNEREGRYVASGGRKDDRIMSLAIGLLQCAGDREIEEIASKAAIDPIYAEFLRMEEEEHETDARGDGRIHVL
jgi:hypothetical protein